MKEKEIKVKMLSVSNFNFSILTELFQGKPKIVVDKKTGKEYEVFKKNIKINGKDVPFIFKRDLETNKLIPQLPKNTKTAPSKKEKNSNSEKNK